MKLFRRRPALPADRKPALEPEERVLAWSWVGEPGGAQVLVATNRGLWISAAVRVGWHEIHKAAWSGNELRITPAEVAQQREGYTVLVDGPVSVHPLTAPGDLPDQVRTRVTKSVAYTAHHPLPVGGVRVVGRRVSGLDGLSWAVRYDSGTPVDRAEVTELTDELVASARRATAPPD